MWPRYGYVTSSGYYPAVDAMHDGTAFHRTGGGQVARVRITGSDSQRTATSIWEWPSNDAA